MTELFVVIVLLDDVCRVPVKCQKRHHILMLNAIAMLLRYYRLVHAHLWVMLVHAVRLKKTFSQKERGEMQRGYLGTGFVPVKSEG